MLLSPKVHSLYCGSCSVLWAFYGGLDDRESACNAADMGLIPGSERCTGEKNGYPLQCICLGNSMDRGLVGYSPWGHKESDSTSD